ncbi:hypothetical protein NEOLEDRAFT_1109263 [Neolentinus lepideus HHB14362 ss-1]|uniref:Uncharacterized protein n=1 Tax=Neolentinus lepideus HHB14362 ss-1 TaxID=1314782 RepID=A0A165ULP7_9AGAM|nr:hypothetical protein NEOLEDRAFT_1109263 [Neolentinus lepideus HHB14362 ss-1]
MSRRLVFYGRFLTSAPFRKSVAVYSAVSAHRLLSRLYIFLVVVPLIFRDYYIFPHPLRPCR